MSVHGVNLASDCKLEGATYVPILLRRFSYLL